MLRVFDSVNHRGHAGAKEMRYDQMILMCESPDRMDTFFAALRGQGHSEIVGARRFDLAPALRSHGDDADAIAGSVTAACQRHHGEAPIPADAAEAIRRAAASKMWPEPQAGA